MGIGCAYMHKPKNALILQLCSKKEHTAGSQKRAYAIRPNARYADRIKNPF